MTTYTIEVKSPHRLRIMRDTLYLLMIRNQPVPEALSQLYQALILAKPLGKLEGKQ